MTVQIAYNIQQLTQELVCVFLILEIVRMVQKMLRERLTIDVFHQDAVIRKGDITDEVGMLETIARLKLFTKGFLISDVVNKLWFQAFQEVQLAIELHTIAVAGSSLRCHQLHTVKADLAMSEL